MPHRWDCKTNLDRLRYLNIIQLRDLLEDEETIWCSIRGNSKLQDLLKQKEVKWASNRMLAEQNLSYQPYLKTHKLLLAERYQLLAQLISSLSRKQRKLDNLKARPNLKTSQHLLKQKVAHFVDESESLWQKFLEGNLLLVDFIESFHFTQKFYYRHLVQVEKIQELRTQTRAEWRMKIHSTARPHSSNLASPNAVTVLSPVVMLPTTLLPFIGCSVKNLPPLKQHSAAHLWTPFVPINTTAPELKMIWPQRPDLLQHKEPKDLGPKPPP